MTVDEHMGPAVPTHQYGRCSYDPSKSGEYVCGLLASTHLLVVTDDGSKTTTYTCDAHLDLATRLLSPTDRHPVAYDCLKTPPAMWMRTTADRTGWCYSDEDDTHCTAASIIDDALTTMQGASA